MPPQASRKSSNIARTVYLRMAPTDTITVSGDTYPVYFDWRWGDPDENRDPAAAGDPAFVTTTWIQEGAGRRAQSVLQVDCWSRVGPQGAADGDSFGNRCRALADEVEQVFVGTQAGSSVYKAYMSILDFATNPAAPPDTGICLVCQNSAGDFGMPEARAPLRTDGEMWRTTITFVFRLVQDAAGPTAVYEV